MNHTRRELLGNAIQAGAAFNALSYGRILGASDSIRIGAIGVGNRCRYLLRLLGAIPGNQLVAMCDVYAPRRDFPAEVKAYAEYKQLLERKDIDAVVIGSPDHWHVQMIRDAVAAGKDVYCEKPVTHSLEEGPVLAKAVDASKQIVQIGYQQRSFDVFKAGKDVVASGQLGQITMIQAYWYQNYVKRIPTLPKIDADKLDWNRWLGSAPKQMFNDKRFIQWRWYWDFGGGALTDLFSHWVDAIHWYMGKDSPTSAYMAGEKLALDYWECPDTVNGAWSYPGFQVVYNGTMVSNLDGGGIVFRGTKGMMRVNRDALNVYSEDAAVAERTQGPPPTLTVVSKRDGTIDHLENWLDCVRSRKQPNSPVASAIASARAAHLGNLSYRRGERVTG